MYYVYVLISRKNGRFYTGSTDHVNRRLAEHNEGRSAATRNTRPFDLLLVEAFETRKQAVQREQYLKTGLGRQELHRKFA